MNKKLLIILLPILLLAAVRVSVNKKTLYPGEELIITITATGNDIKFPQISQIDGYSVIGRSSSESITVINGNMKETLSRSYIILPDRNLTIPSFTVIVNGKTYKTKPIKISVTIPKQTKGPYRLDINLSKTDLYLGEPAILTLKFTESQNADTIKIQKPQFDGFAIKLIKRKTLPQGIIYKFLVIPQKTGNYTLGPLMANVGVEVTQPAFDNPFFTVTSEKYETIYSNAVKVKVSPTPENSVYGNFSINLTAKNEVKYSKPLKAVLTITGCGDFYNLPNFNLNVPNATVYASKPQIKTFVQNGKLCGLYKKTFTILAENDYEINSFKLKEFYDGKTKTISTKPIKVKVIGAKPIQNSNSTNSKTSNPSPKRKKSKKISNANFEVLKNVLIFVFGIGAGLLVAFIAYKYFGGKKEDLFSKIKKANEKELFNLLIPYKDDEYIKETLSKLEENIYKNAKNEINKKEIIKRLKKIISS